MGQRDKVFLSLTSHTPSLSPLNCDTSKVGAAVRLSDVPLSSIGTFSSRPTILISDNQLKASIVFSKGSCQIPIKRSASFLVNPPPCARRLRSLRNEVSAVPGLSGP